MSGESCDTDNKNLNKTGTLYAKYTLPFHLLAAGIGIMITPLILNKENRKIIIFYSFPNSIKQNMKDAKDVLVYLIHLIDHV
jgi:hypothetical protein